MTERGVTESIVEQVALAWLEATGWRIAHGPDIAPAMPMVERCNYGEVILSQRLRDALARLNPALPADALEDAFRKLTRPEGADLIQRNRYLHLLLVNGVTVEFRTRECEVRGAQARVIDFDDPGNNDWLAVNQFSVMEQKHIRRPDVVLFVNGLPLAVSGAPFSSSRPTRPRCRCCSRRTRCLPFPTGWRRVWARSAPGASGSSPGARSRVTHWPSRMYRNSRL